ncbi:histone deacetylase family protein [Methanolobus halotolerans]|uniref:Histone deacetylase domain-containing protein n=1 Tax=Methanolobus halotolerans TaxID=2052935 RepID=A0A4E0PW72_9EURY|nr:histone deacetylase [Methanolobus halotolerans]TGC08683.1 hypothetical protein CUN85_08380 [Methanolobus halotolerans]
MSLTENGKDKRNDRRSPEKDPDTLKQKLNVAMSSCFCDIPSKGPDENPEHGTESLPDIVKDGPDEDISLPVKHEVAGGDCIIGPEYPACDVDPKETPFSADSGPDKDADLNTEIFSGAFEEIEYQSVEIEMAEEQSPTKSEEVSSKYEQIVKDALKASPKQRVKTVLDTEFKTPCPVSTDRQQAFSGNIETEACSVQQNMKTPVPQKNQTSSLFGVQSRQKQNMFSCGWKKDVQKDELSQEAADAITSGVAFLYDEKHVEHSPSSLSLHAHESPGRLIKAMWYLEKNGIFRNEQCSLMNDFDMASDEDLLRVHDDSYIKFVKSYSAAGGGFLGDSTYMTSRSYEVAKLSAGAAIKAGSLVADGKYPYAFVMTRPPGHHATGSKYGGFCLFNNAAILARYLQEKKNIGRIMIVDWDAHAGDGTMDIFYKDPTVLFVSLHRDPHGFYPRKGFSKETGDEAGRGYTVNVEMPVGAGDEEYSLAFEEVVIPLVKSFAPEFIICSCGFDAYYKEKNIGMSLTSDGFHKMTSMIRTLYQKNFVLLMEGGYHDFNGQLCHSVLSALLEEPNPVSDRPAISSFKKNQQRQVLMDTKMKIAEVKALRSILI